MKFKFIIALLLIAIAPNTFSQELVENGSFEELDKKPKNPGEVFLASPWVGGTKAVPDLYSKSAKNEDIEVPINAYGDEEPQDGENYAGILIYSDREKEPRSYLSTKLKYPMLAGENYCVKFHISFADLSKYATNNIGAYVSQDSIASETELYLNYTPQIINSTNRIFEKQWSWEDICRIYVADGGEQYLTIGNFAPQADVLKKAVKRPPGYTTTQFRDGYYYIDNISVLPNATPENCKCEPGNFAFANLNKEEAEFQTADEDIPDVVIIGTTESLKDVMPDSENIEESITIGFAVTKHLFAASENSKLDQVVAHLKENKDSKVKLVGHNDSSEKVVTGLSGNRAKSVEKYLVSKGIDQGRISIEDVKDSQPLDTSGLKENRDQNMVVEIIYSN